MKKFSDSSLEKLSVGCNSIDNIAFEEAKNMKLEKGDGNIILEHRNLFDTVYLVNKQIGISDDQARKSAKATTLALLSSSFLSSQF